MSELTEDQNAKILEAVFAGQKIRAIKIYREATGCSLVEAKDFIEGLEGRLRVERPEAFAASSTKSGCGIALLLMGAGVVGWFTLLAYC